MTTRDRNRNAVGRLTNKICSTILYGFIQNLKYKIRILTKNVAGLHFVLYITYRKRDIGDNLDACKSQLDNRDKATSRLSCLAFYAFDGMTSCKVSILILFNFIFII